MSLVAYASSDDSDNSDEEKEEQTPVKSNVIEPSVPKLHSHSKVADPIPENPVKLATDSPTIGTSAAENELLDDRFSDSDSEETPITDAPVQTLLKGLPEPKERLSPSIDTDDVLEEEVKPKPSQMVDVPKPPPKKDKQPVKIIIPSLDDDSDEENGPSSKKRKIGPQVDKKSGLTSLLPPPVHAARKEANRILVPHSLTKRPKPTVNNSHKTAETTTNSNASLLLKPNKIPVLSGYGSESDSEEEGETTNFFSLPSKLEGSQEKITAAPMVLPDDSVSKLVKLKESNDDKTDDIPTVELPPGVQSKMHKMELPSPKNLGSDLETVSSQSSNIDPDAPLTVKGPQLPDPDAPLTFKGGVTPAIQMFSTHTRRFSSEDTAASTSEDNSYSYNPQYDPDQMEYQSYPEPEDSFEQDAEFQRIQGKKQRGKEEINIVDVNADDFINTVDVTKSISEEKEYRSHRKKDNQPTSQQKRKHQIKYLAFEAKERELSLKNSWAENRVTRKQTQAKYGF